MTQHNDSRQEFEHELHRWCQESTIENHVKADGSHVWDRTKYVARRAAEWQADKASEAGIRSSLIVDELVSAIEPAGETRRQRVVLKGKYRLAEGEILYTHPTASVSAQQAEAEPVGYISNHGIRYLDHKGEFRRQFSVTNKQTSKCNVPLYTTPPAPAPVVPKEGVLPKMPEPDLRAIVGKDGHGNPAEGLAFSTRKMLEYAQSVYRSMSSPAPQQHSGVPDTITSVLNELSNAITKFPTWPTDPLHAIGVVNEEVGELNKAVLQSVYEPEKQPSDAVTKEALQAAAMCLRFIESIDKYQYAESEQHSQSALAAAPQPEQEDGHEQNS